MGQIEKMLMVCIREIILSLVFSVRGSDMSDFRSLHTHPRYSQYSTESKISNVRYLEQDYLVDSACLTYSHKYILGYTKKINEFKLEQ